MISLCVMGSLIDVGGQTKMVVALRGPWGLGALSLQRPPCGALPVGIRCCESFRWGPGGAGRGVITHACEAKASEGNEVRRMLPSQRVVSSFHPDTDPPASLSAAAHASRPVARSPPLPLLGQSDVLQWGPGSGAHPGRSSQAGSRGCFQAFHHITSDQKQ